MIDGLIGVVHLPAMPGDPGHRGEGFSGVLAHALADAETLVAGGVDALIIENFGSVPFVKGTPDDRLPAHQVAFFARVAVTLRERVSLPLGVNCLRNDARSALGIAAACELDFIRVNVHIGAYLTDQGVIEGEASGTLRSRSALGAEHVAILADVLVKHAVPLAATDPAQATRDTLERGLADGVIVSGEATGAAVSAERLAIVSAAAGSRPIFVGSGLTAENAAELAMLCHGAIVGTACKRHGDVSAPVERARVERLVAATRGRFRELSDKLAEQGRRGPESELS